jgi:hypothetical protein
MDFSGSHWKMLTKKEYNVSISSMVLTFSEVPVNAELVSTKEFLQGDLIQVEYYIIHIYVNYIYRV